MLRTLRRGMIPLACGLTAALLAGPPVAAARHEADPAPLWATQLQFDDDGMPWSTDSLAALRSDGISSVEINMPWGQIEPSRGSFDFGELDQELANAAAAGVRVVPIFWQAGWGGSPAPWITSREVTSTGGTGIAPAWWNTTEQADYFEYVTTTLAHVTGNAGYGGAILDYGRLDAQWSNNGDGGWAPEDIAYFHGDWLPATYGTIAAFNAEYGTSYPSFDQVPAAVPGDPLDGVYQAFRQWSVQDTYGRLTAAARRVTDGPLYYYFGGHIANAPDIGNLPDVFFALARRYKVTVIEDAAQSPGLTLTFGSLARAYQVPLAQEWTAPDEAEMPAQAVQWLSNYAMGLPYGGGEDFFIHDGTSKDVIGFPIYTKWLPVLAGLSGAYPQQPAAVYIDYSRARGNDSGGSLGNVENELTALWSRDQAGFAVVTSDEIADHADSLSRYRAVLPLNGVDANLTAYQQGGGTLLDDPDQLAGYAPAYAELSSAHALQAVPATAADHRSASVTLAEVSPYFDYDGSVVLQPNGLDLVPGAYHVQDAVTGAVPAQQALSDGGICAPLSLASAQLAQWRVVPGSAPAGTPVPATCPVTGGGATTVTGTAGQDGGGAVFLGVGDTGQGADGNLTATTQGGQAAYATWTSAQSGAPTANAYLQVDPGSQVASAGTLTLAVTYWSVAGQGFQVQYDAPGDPYHDGPTVTGSGTGSWQTATVTLSGAQLDEAQNLAADLRLVVADPGQPLYVHGVSLSVG